MVSVEYTPINVLKKTFNVDDVKIYIKKERGIIYSQ